MIEPCEMVEAVIAGRRTLVVGVGNPSLADGGVGPYVAGRLARTHPERVLDAGESPENFLGPMLSAAPDVVLFVDAADHGGSPGAWRLGPMRDFELRPACAHDASLRLLTSLLEAEGVRCWVIGIQPLCLESGEMSRDVLASGRRLARLLGRVMAMEPADA
jgi:hydrogenase maturation protease